MKLLLYYRRIKWFFIGAIDHFYWCEFQHYYYMKKFKEND